MTHRMSIPIGDNEFIIETPSRNFYSTATEREILAREIHPEYTKALTEHTETGYSARCIICKAQPAPDPDDVLWARTSALRAELQENPDKERACAIIDELAEIANRLQADGEAMSDYGRIGEPLTRRQIVNLRRDAAAILTAPERPLVKK